MKTCHCCKRTNVKLFYDCYYHDYECEDCDYDAVIEGCFYCEKEEANEEQLVLSVTLTPTANYNPGDIVYFNLYRDDSADNTTFGILLLWLDFQYTEA